MHPHPPTARPCPVCKGDGRELIPDCRGGYDHAGHNCGGRVCGHIDVGPCPECIDGALPCARCGEEVATHWPDRWGICDRCNAIGQEEAA